MAHFFAEGTASNASFGEPPTVEIGFRATALILAVDSGGPLLASFEKNGVVHAKVLFGDKFLALDCVDVSRIWFKAAVATEWRVFAWESQR